MCGRYAQFGPVRPSRQAREAFDRLGLDIEGALNPREPQYNIAPTQQAPVVAMEQKGLEQKEQKGLEQKEQKGSGSFG